MTIDVSGLDEFDIGDFSTELDDAKKLLDLGIGSETLKKQVFKKLAFKYLCDARQEVKNRIAAGDRRRARTARTDSERRVWTNRVRAVSNRMQKSTFKRLCGRRSQEFVQQEQAQDRAGV